MNVDLLQLDDHKIYEILRDRLRRVGIVAIECTMDGAIALGPDRGKDWLASLLLSSPLVRAALADAAARWKGNADPGPEEIVDGVVLIPVPLTARRRRAGYLVAIAPTPGLHDSAFLPAMCQSAELDRAVCGSLLRDLPPLPSTEIDRVATMLREAHEDQVLLEQNGRAIETFGQQLAWSYEEISLLYTITSNMTMAQRPERFVRLVCNELLDTLPYRWIVTLVADNRERVKGLAGRLFVSGSFACPAEELRDFASRMLAEAEVDKPRIVDSVASRSDAKFRALGHAIVVQPIVSDDEIIGILIAGDKQGGDPLASSIDIKLLTATSSYLAVFIENAALYDDLNVMFLGTLEALTASIDAKDAYTCGHSQRVAHLTQALAEAVGLDEHAVSRMHIAGLVHDVGKIGVPERVLLKPGRLTKEEFGWIRKHPEMGYRILKDIPQLSDVLPGVLYHHERWDGRGYPQGLVAEEIPMCARLIGLADAFDAMSSDRTYRSALSRDEVIREIRDCAGTQFDPDLAPTFIQLDFGEYDRLVLAHQEIDLGPTGEVA